MQEKEYFVPVEDLWNITENKYKALIVIEREARRIFLVNPQSDKNPVVRAIKQFVNGEIKYEEEKE
jgi:DNA-directed RNA polymerase subunit K/omega